MAKDRDEVLREVKENGLNLRLWPEWQDDKEVVLTAVKQNWRAMGFVSLRLCDNPDVVRAASDQDVGALVYASARLRNECYFMEEEVCKDPGALWFVSERLLHDRCLLKSAVTRDGTLFFLAPHEFKEDVDFVAEIVREQPEAVRYMDEELFEPKTVRRLLDVNWRALCFMRPEQKNDQSLIKKLVKDNPDSMQCISSDLRGDRLFIRTIVSINWNAAEYASDELKNDKDFMVSLFDQDPRAIVFASEEVFRSFIEDLLPQPLEEMYSNVIPYSPQSSDVRCRVCDTLILERDAVAHKSQEGAIHPFHRECLKDYVLTTLLDKKKPFCPVDREPFFEREGAFQTG